MVFLVNIVAIFFLLHQILTEPQFRPTNLKIDTHLVLSFTYAPSSIHQQRLSGCKARGIRHKI